MTLRDFPEDLEEVELAFEGVLEWPDGGEMEVVDSSGSLKGVSRVGGVGMLLSGSTRLERRWARCSGEGSLPGWIVA